MVSDGQESRSAGFCLEMHSSVEAGGCSPFRSRVHGGDRLASSWAGPMERTRTCRQNQHSSTRVQYNVQTGSGRLLTARFSSHAYQMALDTQACQNRDAGLKLTWTSS